MRLVAVMGKPAQGEWEYVLWAPQVDVSWVAR